MGGMERLSATPAASRTLRGDAIQMHRIETNDNTPDSQSAEV